MLDRVLTKLNSPDRLTRMLAAETLGSIGGEQVVELLTSALEDVEGVVRLAAAESLARLGDIQPLLSRLQDKEWGIRALAAYDLGRLGDGRAIEPLIALLQDNWEPVQSNAALALRMIGTPEALAAANRWREHTLQHQLMRNLVFTPDDLRANQQGKLSERQQAFFRSSLDPRSWWPYIAYMTIFFVGLAIYILFFSTNANFVRNDRLTVFTIAGLIASPTIVALVTAVWARWKLNRIDFWRVQMVQGEIRIEASEHEALYVLLKAHRLKIGGRTFTVSGTQANAFTKDAKYRIYFVKVWMTTILSAEFVSDD